MRLSTLVIVALIVTSYCVKVDSFSCALIPSDFLKSLFEKLLNFLGVQDVYFYFYSGKSNGPIEMSQDIDKLKHLDFDPTRETRIIIHGFSSHIKTPWVKELVKKLLKWKNMNIIVLDWSNVFVKTKYDYSKAAHRTTLVALRTYKFLRKLAMAFDVDLEQWKYIHLIGHSLGAHVAGHLAKHLSQEAKVHRITAFDPARPSFEGNNTYLRLKKEYAQFVDVIHTNSQPDLMTLGLHEPLGHIDYYPNGGDRQPCCRIQGKVRVVRTFTEGPVSKCLSFSVFGIDATRLYKNYMYRKKHGDDMICDHAEGQEYFIQSIDNEIKFVAHKANYSEIHVRKKDKYSYTNCGNDMCVEMGINAYKYSDNPKYYGTYYLNIPKCSRRLTH